MSWNLNEAVCYYQRQGAPSDQTALVNLLKEVQQESGGGISSQAVAEIARSYGLKESYLLAVIKRFPSLRLNHRPCLELCGGPNCTRQARLAAFVRKTYGTSPKDFEVKITGCMRMCGKGPNIKWNGTIYNGADEALIRSLIQKKR